MFENVTNTYFWLWWSVTSLQYAILGWAITRCFDLKIKKWLYLMIHTGLVLLPMSASLIGGQIADLKPILSFISPLVLMLFVAKGSKISIVLFNGVNQMLDFALELILVLGVKLLIPNYVTDTIELYTESRVNITLIFLLMVIPQKYFFIKVWNRVVKRDSPAAVSWIYTLFPIGQIIVVFCVMYSSLDENDIFGIPHRLMAVLGFVILAALDVLFMFYLSDIEKNHRLCQELQQLEHARNLEHQHYSNIESKQYETAKIRHDIKNQLFSVKRLIETNNIEKAQELIADIENDLSAAAENEYCSVPVVNALITQKAEECRRHGIELTTDISITEIGEIRPMHLCSIFSNLIDNAINANKAIPTEAEHFIMLKAANKQGFLAVSAENPVADNKTVVIDPSRSSGYGLKILRDIASEYGGQFTAECRDGRCRAIITVSCTETKQEVGK